MESVTVRGRPGEGPKAKVGQESMGQKAWCRNEGRRALSRSQGEREAGRGQSLAELRQRSQTEPPSRPRMDASRE